MFPLYSLPLTDLHPPYYSTRSIPSMYMPTYPIPSPSSDAGEDVQRSLELSAYFTHCNLQPAHLMLALKTAMAAAFKAKVSKTGR